MVEMRASAIVEYLNTAEGGKALVRVPCNGCTLCCRKDAIVLKPSLGDNPSEYDCVPVEPGDVPEFLAELQPPEDSVWRLRHVNGRCVYLGNGGCTIHGRQPTVCRTFDCRRLVRATGKRELRALIKSGAFSASVAKRGMDLNKRPETWVRGHNNV